MRLHPSRAPDDLLVRHPVQVFVVRQSRRPRSIGCCQFPSERPHRRAGSVESGSHPSVSAAVDVQLFAAPTGRLGL
jgi:hypothetical protein